MWYKLFERRNKYLKKRKTESLEKVQHNKFENVKDRSTRLIVVLVVIKFFLFGYFLVGWFQDSSLRICDLLLNLYFGVLAVTCRLHNLWSQFKIPFYLVSPIVFSFRVHAFFTWGPYAAFHRMTLICVTLNIPL
jgi:hypothetical protein